MQTTIVKWGNSHGIRIPKTFLQSIRVTENDPVEMTIKDHKIIIKKIHADAHKSTKERLKEFYGVKFEKNIEPQNEINWGKPAGKEEW